MKRYRRLLYLSWLGLGIAMAVPACSSPTMPPLPEAPEVEPPEPPEDG